MGDDPYINAIKYDYTPKPVDKDAEIARLTKRVRWLEEMLRAKDLLLGAHRIGDRRRADKALIMIEELGPDPDAHPEPDVAELGEGGGGA